MADAKYTKPASQVDLEERQKKGNQSARVLPSAPQFEGGKDDGRARQMTVPGNDTDGYIGVDPVYQNYANETEAPIEADESAESKVADEYADQAEVAQLSQPVAKVERDEENEEDEEDEEPQGSPTPPTPSTQS